MSNTDHPKVEDYESSLRIRNGKYFFYIRELHLAGVGDSVDTAYQDLKEKVEKQFHEFSDGELLDGPPQNRSLAFRIGPRDSGNLPVFFIKSLVVLLIVGGAFLFVAHKVDSLLSQIPKRPGDKLEMELHRAVDHDFSPERKEKIIKSLRILVQRHKPIVDELKLLFADPPAEPPAPIDPVAPINPAAPTASPKPAEPE